MKHHNQENLRHHGIANNRGRNLAMLLFCLFSVTAVADECGSLSKIHWLAGEWISVGEQAIISESWQSLSDMSWEGSGETRDKTSGELRGSESLRLLAMGGEVFYVAKVDHNELPVAFKLTKCSDDRAVFENPGHGFPKKIDYQLQAENGLLVQVSDGADQGFEIRFQKAK